MANALDLSPSHLTSICSCNEVSGFVFHVLGVQDWSKSSPTDTFYI